MADKSNPDQSPYDPTTIAKVFELLDNKLVSLGVPGALSFVGITKVRDGHYWPAAGCFAAAAGVWLVIALGKKLAPRLDQGLDWLLNQTGKVLVNAKAKFNFTSLYLQQQARLCEEFTAEGLNPDRTAIPLLEEVFVPLDLSSALGQLNPEKKHQPRTPWLQDPTLHSPDLSIWHLLAKSPRQQPFRQLVIQAKGGMGKTTLLRHVALIYGQGKHRQARYRGPDLVPVLLRLRDWHDLLSQSHPPSLPQLISQHHLPSLSKNHPLTPPPHWAEILLTQGRALVMFDGFDEVPETLRPRVSHWLSAQMQEYRQTRSVFILTSRPAGYRDYTAQKPAIPIFINQFTPQQQADFIHRWYRCQERCFRSPRQQRQAKAVARERANHLIQQLQARRAELGYLAENPLLLNLLVTFHRFDPAAELPRWRIDLYRNICKLQLDDRPRARLIRMLLPWEKSQALLQTLALALVKANQTKLQRANLLRFLDKLPLWQQEDVAAADWLQQMLDVSELLVEREPQEYEFPHLSFQGFFAATKLAQTEDQKTLQTNAQMVIQNWTGAIWRETVLLYTAQLPPKLLAPVIRQACTQGSEAADLAAACLKEYPRPDKLSADLMALIQQLDTITQNAKYQPLESLLKAGEWRKADYETYRLMITTVGKEEGQWFDRKDLETFPCEDLRILDQLWRHYSKTPDHPQGKWGFSVQKEIWQACGSPMTYNRDWEKFGDRVGWRKDGDWLSLNEFFGSSGIDRFFPGSLPLWILGRFLPGSLPLRGGWFFREYGGLVGGEFERMVGMALFLSLLSRPDL